MHYLSVSQQESSCILPEHLDRSRKPDIEKQILKDNTGVSNTNKFYRNTATNQVAESYQPQSLASKHSELCFGSKQNIISPIIDKVIEETKEAMSIGQELYLEGPLWAKSFLDKKKLIGAERIYSNASNKNKKVLSKLIDSKTCPGHLISDMDKICISSSFFAPKELANNSKLLNSVISSLISLSKENENDRKFAKKHDVFLEHTSELIDKLVLSKKARGINQFKTFLDYEIFELTKRQIASYIKYGKSEEEIKKAFVNSTEVEIEINSIIEPHNRCDIDQLHQFILKSSSLLEDLNNL